MRTTVLLLFLLAAQPMGAADEEKHDVQKLHEMCKLPPGETKAAICLGFISGVAEMMRLMSFSRYKEVRGAFGQCSEASYGAAMQAFMNWADKHPERWSKPMVVGVIEALNETWPCGDLHP
jgi:hypothetical protein